MPRRNYRVGAGQSRRGLAPTRLHPQPITGRTLSGLEAVSYTHLDVYKRQGFSGIGRSDGQELGADDALCAEPARPAADRSLVVVAPSTRVVYYDARSIPDIRGHGNGKAAAAEVGTLTNETLLSVRDLVVHFGSTGGREGCSSLYRYL